MFENESDDDWLARNLAAADDCEFIKRENEVLSKALFELQGKYNKLMDALVEIRVAMHRNYDDSYYLEDIDRIIEEATKP